MTRSDHDWRVLAQLMEYAPGSWDEIEKANGKNFNMLSLDVDGLRHEVRKFGGAGVIEMPSFLGSEGQRAN